jgi:polysaccharide export outer membrane protein
VRNILLSSVIASCMALAACSPGSDLPPLPQTAAASDYTLGPGDRLRIITYGDDQLTGDFTVSDGGTIEVPLLGAVRAQGRTIGEIQTSMMAELKHRGLLQKPSVSVEISAYRPFFVLGEVTKPDMSVVTAVAVAGGYTYRAVKSRASITRNVDGHTITGQATPETRVEPGDVINIFERSF